MTAEVRRTRSKACTASETCEAPPPNTTRRRPITAAAASWTAWGSDPIEVTRPAAGSTADTAVTEDPAASSPPATYSTPFQETATARCTGAGSTNPAARIRRVGRTGPGPTVRVVRDAGGPPLPVHAARMRVAAANGTTRA